MWSWPRLADHSTILGDEETNQLGSRPNIIQPLDSCWCAFIWCFILTKPHICIFHVNAFLGLVCGKFEHKWKPQLHILSTHWFSPLGLLCKLCKLCSFFLGFLLPQFLLETIIWFLPLILIIGLLELDHLMAFAQGKQGTHLQYHRSGDGGGSKRDIWERKGQEEEEGGHFEISEEHLPFGVLLIDLLVQDGYHKHWYL